MKFIKVTSEHGIKLLIEVTGIVVKEEAILGSVVYPGGIFENRIDIKESIEDIEKILGRIE